jgi:iron complex transport system substrate-binding protein
MKANTRYGTWSALYLLVCTAFFSCGREPSAAPSGQARRIITLTPSMTEVVNALGATDRLVGVDEFSASLAAIEHRGIPKVGDFLSPNLEAMLALHPDIVLLDAVQEKFASHLKQSGIKVFAIPLQTVAEVRAALETVGGALGREDRAKAIVTQLDDNLAVLTSQGKKNAAERGGKPRVLFVVDRRPGGLAGMVAAGPDTYIDELLTRAGAQNVLADAAARYVQLPVEEVLRRAPDIIFDAAHDTTDRGRSDWAALVTVPAVAHGRVYLLADPVYVTPGPHLAEALKGLSEKIWEADADGRVHSP